MLRGFALVASLAAALAFTSAASADQPVKIPAPSPDVTGAYCPDFDVAIHYTANKEYFKVFSDGAVAITGQFKAELTNVENDKTVSINISGPGSLSADGSTFILSGRSLLFGEPGFFGPGAPATLLITSGPTTLTLDENGNILGYTTSGHTIDMCEALA